MLYGVLAAVLFGVGVPLSKLLLRDVDPILLAGLLYAGAGISLGLLVLVRRALGARELEARLERRDLPWLAGAVLAGGVAGPILLLVGLERTSAATASLLLNLEVVATGLFALALFRERVGLRTWGAIAAVAAGGALLSLDPSSGWTGSLGALAVVGACFAWGLDNNLTGRISLKDPSRIVAVKGLAAGSFSLALAAGLGRLWPAWSQVLLALLLGAASYGASISLFVQSLRRVGAARTGVLFGLAPFVGAALSLLVFRELPGWAFFVSLGLMAAAAFVLAGERHEHRHVHLDTVHAHAHRHDDGHHAHDHPDGVAAATRHAHAHAHPRLLHSHPHAPDAHHRHPHRKAG
ncbi:MAG: DMT family transporter [Candidatus Bipolaricaulota bacterium]